MFPTKQHCSVINGTDYEAHRYCIPQRLFKRIKFIKRYFQVMDKLEIPTIHRRRKNWIEYAETAVMMLGRLDTFCSTGTPIIVGSKYLSAVPWAIFGNEDGITNILGAAAKHHFKNVIGVGDFYSHFLDTNNAEYQNFYFRLVPNLTHQVAEKYKLTPHYVMVIALALLSDLLMHCGPDTKELYDLYTNDFRDDNELVDPYKWQMVRCKVWGRNGKLGEKPFNVRIGQLYEPFIPVVSTTTIEELIVEADDLAVGEKLVPIYTEYEDPGDPPMERLPEDDDPPWPKSDSKHMPPMLREQLERKMRKYHSLGLSHPAYM